MGWRAGRRGPHVTQGGRIVKKMGRKPKGPKRRFRCRRCGCLAAATAATIKAWGLTCNKCIVAARAGRMVAETQRRRRPQDAPPPGQIAVYRDRAEKGLPIFVDTEV